MQLTGKEEFKFGNESVGLTILDFWQFKYSNIYNMQEIIAEFLVAKALEKTEADNDEYWTLWDVSYRGKRIEVKETSYYHPWNEGKKVSNQRAWSIGKANSSYEDEDTINNRYERQNDIYVFCLNDGETKETANPLDLNNWKFYVVPTSFINEHCGDNKTISLGRVQKFGFEAKTYYNLKETIDAYIDEIEFC